MTEQLILNPRDHRKAVGDRLRRAIDALGISYVEAAAEMGITKNHLGNWMRGAAYPLPYPLYRLCRIRGVTMDWVFLGDPSGLRAEVRKPLLEQELEQVGPSAPARPAA